jgi:hypothetical protein
MPCSSYSPSFAHANNVRCRIQFTKLLITQISTSTRYFLYLRSKYSSQHPHYPVGSRYEYSVQNLHSGGALLEPRSGQRLSWFRVSWVNAVLVRHSDHDHAFPIFSNSSVILPSTVMSIDIENPPLHSTLSIGVHKFLL